MPGPWGDYPSRGPSLCPSPGQRARDALLANHYRSDNAIAAAADCSFSTVAHVRRLLEEDGVIGLIEATHRTARTRVPCADPAPFIPAPPPMPEALRRGTCVSHPDPRLWEATRNPGRREQALALCAACPVLQPCREWALQLSPFMDRNIGIVGGYLVADRDRLRRQRRAAAQTARAALAATPPRRKPSTPAKEPRP
jgi:Transcription factor WhiB